MATTVAMTEGGRADRSPGAGTRRAVGLLVTGQATSTVGDACCAVALPWYVLSGHGGASMLGATLASYGVARAAAMPVGGWLCDRLGARRVLLVVDTVRTALMAALAAQAGLGRFSLPVLLLLSALIGAGQGCFVPGSYALMPSIAPEDRLQGANAALTGALQAGSLIGPLIGAAVVVASGPATAFGLDATTFAVSAITLALLPAGRVAPDPSPSTGLKVRAVVAATPALPIMLAVVLSGNLASGGTFSVALPVLAHRHFGASGYGLVLAALAVGALAGTALGGAIHPRRPAVAAARFLLAQTAAQALIPLAGLPGATIAALAFGAANAIGELIIVTALQQSFPSPVLGRIMGLVMLASAGAFPVSVALTSAVAHSVGASATFPLGAAITAAAIVVALSRAPFRAFAAKGA
jgi:predicted MFS family arabinose efflux permease